MTEPTFAWTANGRPLHVDLRDARAHELVAADGNLNPLSLALWQQVLHAYPWELVVDVGVNYGEMLVGVDLPDGATLIGFEPNPTIRALARRTFADNALTVDLRPEAVAAAPGIARFAIDTDWSGMSSLAVDGSDDGHHALLDVPVTTLDAVVPVDVASFCVKVDVEGFEADVVSGARDCLARPVPWAVMLEVLHMPAGLLTSLAAQHPVVAMDRHTRQLERVSPDSVEADMRDPRIYGQDCLLVSDAALPALLG